MPRRVQLMYKGLQQYPAPGAGEVYHDVFSLGKVLLRLLAFPEGDLEPPFARADDDLQKEDTSVKNAALELLELPRLEGGAPPEVSCQSAGLVSRMRMHGGCYLLHAS